MKLTPWFPNSIRPVRVGVYEILGSCFRGRNYRKWNGLGWSDTYDHFLGAVEIDNRTTYQHGYDMTGWRGIEK